MKTDVFVFYYKKATIKRIAVSPLILEYIGGKNIGRSYSILTVNKTATTIGITTDMIFIQIEYLLILSFI